MAPQNAILAEPENCHISEGKILSVMFSVTYQRLLDSLTLIRLPCELRGGCPSYYNSF